MKNNGRCCVSRLSSYHTPYCIPKLKIDYATSIFMRGRLLNRYLPSCFEPPTLLGLDDSLQASMSFFSINKHSRNNVKNGWCDKRQRDVNEWLRILWKWGKYYIRVIYKCGRNGPFTCRLRLALGEGEWLPPLSESLAGAVTPSLGGCTTGMLLVWTVSESLLLGQSLSESLGPILLLL